MDMWRGSTPTLAFRFPFKTEDINALTLKCNQLGTTKISKSLTDFEESGEYILYTLLTQADTLALTGSDYVNMQFKVQFDNNHVVPSSLMKMAVNDVLDTVVMSGTATLEAPTFAIDVPFPEVDGAFSVEMGMVVVNGSGGTSDFDELTNRPKYNGSTMTHSTNIPEVKTATWDAKANAGDIPTKTSDLTNDSGFLTSHQSLSAYRTSSAQDVIDNTKANQNALDLANRRIDALFKVNEGQTFDFDVDTATCYSATVPSGAVADSVTMVGGKSVVMNQLVQNGNFESGDEWGIVDGTILVSNNEATVTVTGSNCYIGTPINIPSGHICLISAYSSNTNGLITSGLSTDWSSAFWGVLSSSAGYGYLRISVTLSCSYIMFNLTNSQAGDVVTIKNINVIDLTAMFGSGNEPTTVAQVKAMLPNEYYAYNTGELIHAPVKSVVVKDDDSVVTSTTQIPQAIQSLTGYGQSNGSTYNYVDFANKKYHYFGQYVDGVWAASQEAITDISNLLDVGFLEAFEVESGGSITFVSDTQDNYRLPVPNTNEFIVKLNEV